MRGRAAAEAVGDALQALTVPPERYAAWHAAFTRPRPTPPRVDEIEIAGTNRIDTRTVAGDISQATGQPIDPNRLRADLLRVYGRGAYEHVDYTLITRNGKNVLRVLPVEKSWGPDYLRFAIDLSTSLSQGSTYDLRAGYQKTLLNPLGGEFLAVAEVGNNLGVSAAFYQPLDFAHRFFVDTDIGYRREQLDIFQLDTRIAQYQIFRGTVGVAAGMNIGTVGAVRLGWRDTVLRESLETGPPLVPKATDRLHGWQATLDLDRLNGLYFPSRGWSINASLFDASQSSGGYARLDVELRAAIPLGGVVLGGRYAYTGSPRGTLPPIDGATLGGFLNLSAFSPGEMIGDSSHYANVRLEKIIGRLPMGLRGDMRLGMAFEAARLGMPLTDYRATGQLHSATVYLGGETPVGPVYIGAGYGGSGIYNAYFVIGAP